MLRLILLCFAFVFSEGTSLYADSPFVLEVATFPAQAKCPWYVVFYVSWCGHCQSFAPFYKKFAMDMYNDTLGTAIFAIDCVKYEAHCQALNITDFPTMMYYDGDRPQRMQINHHEFSTGKPIASISKDTVAGHKECIAQKQRRLKEAHVATPHTDKPTWSNPYLAFHYAMEHEVPPAVKAAAQALEANSADSSHQTTPPASKEVEIFMKFQKYAYASVPSLRSPKGPVGEKGCVYTCGLWKLFHSMLEGPEPLQTLHAIKDYVITFFSCLECRKHFAEMAQGMDSTVWDATSARLWLWKAHNKVNLRLHHAFFPSREQCQNCATDDDVLEFLHKRYAAPKPKLEKDLSKIMAVSEKIGDSEGPSGMDPIAIVLLIAVVVSILIVVGLNWAPNSSRRAMQWVGVSKRDHTN